MMEFSIRNAEVEDLDAIMQVEAHWPKEQRSSEEKFRSRLEKFPQGFFLAEANGEVVAVSTSTLTNYDPADLASFRSWEKCTNDGYLYPLNAVDEYNALFIVSNGIMKQARKKGIREEMIRAHFSLAVHLGLQYIATGAMMPGYDAYCSEHGETEISDYAFMMKNGCPIDPTLNKLSSLGLLLPDPRHIIEGYYMSPESRNYGALLVHNTRP